MDLLRILDGTPEPSVIDLQLESVDDSGDYNLATPIYEFQKELTDQIVSLHYPDILKYCETNDNKDLIRKSLEICIENCMLVTSHPYLLISHYMPKNLTSKDMPAKLAETSGKFNVLKDLMNVIIRTSRGRSKNVAIVMKNNTKFFDLVEALLLGCEGNKLIKRYLGNYIKKDSGKNKNPSNKEDSACIIHLLPEDGKCNRDEDQIPQIAFDIVIVFDGYVDTSGEFFTTIRSQNKRKEAVVIRLIPMKSIEHCKLYYSDQKESPSYLYKLISSIVCLRDQIGNLPPDIFPIYNQNLNYLSSKFFDQLFKNSNRKYPAWPLPELPSFREYSPTDVERSLLTEVHFHFTPYDSNDLNGGENEKSKNTEPKKTYYETKRLQSDYVSNPLKNNYDKLIGISSSDSSSNIPINSSFQSPEVNLKILTHRLILQLSETHAKFERVEQSYNSFINYNEASVQTKVGRREKESKSVLWRIGEEMDHADFRMTSAEKQIAKKTEEIEKLKEQTKSLSSELTNYIDNNSIEDPKKKTFVENQLKLWTLSNDIEEYVKRIKLKNEEKNYMASEYERSLESINTSKNEITTVKESNREKKRKLEEIHESENGERSLFKNKKDVTILSLQEEISKNVALKKSLDHSFKFLKDTSHLKKRKSRGQTPGGK